MVEYNRFNESEKHTNEFLKLRKKFYVSKEWRLTRLKVLERDLNQCQICGKYVSKGAHIDHIVELTESNFDNDDIRINLDNLQTLCKKCHDSKTRLGHQEKIRRDIDFSKRSILFEK